VDRKAKDRYASQGRNCSACDQDHAKGYGLFWYQRWSLDLGFSEVKALASVLREGVIRVFNTAKAMKTGDKMHLLYGYLTSGEFAEQWKAIREDFWL
jgi:hypothetical protein